MDNEKRKVIFLEGERLYLRPVEEGDVMRCQRWINDPEIRQFVRNQRPVSILAELQWVRAMPEAEAFPMNIRLAIVLDEGDRHIGTIGLHSIDWIERTATTGMLIGEKDCWDKGYGHEAKELLLAFAFDSLHLHRIASGALESNPRSMACLKKSGYVEEGRSRDAYYRDGRWVAHVHFGVLASEWRARRNKA